jgi:hypothetical protein
MTKTMIFLSKTIGSGIDIVYQVPYDGVRLLEELPVMRRSRHPRGQ